MLKINKKEERLWAFWEWAIKHSVLTHDIGMGYKCRHFVSVGMWRLESFYAWGQ